MPHVTPTADQLRQQADDLARQAAEAQAALDARAEQERAREAERQAEADRKLMESYDRRAIDREVEEARERFERAVRDAELTRALADLIAAGYRRNHRVLEAQSAHNRLGMPGDGPRATEQLVIPTLSDAITRAAERVAMQIINNEPKEQ